MGSCEVSRAFKNIYPHRNRIQ